MSRIAARNGVSARAFGQDMGIPFGAVIDGNAEAIEKLATLTNASCEDLRAWSPQNMGARRHSFRGEMFHARGIKDTVIRGCPACLREDAAASDRPPEQSMAIRGHWLARHVSLCIKHEHPLIPLWTVASVIERYDSAAQLANQAAALISGALDTKPRAPDQFDFWIEGRLNGKCSGKSWLDQFPLYAAAHFCELLGRAIYAVRIPNWRKLYPRDEWISPDLGFHYATQGEEVIRGILVDLQRKIGMPTDGPKRKFGDLYDRLAHDLLSDDYRPFRALLRDHIATTWPLGPGDELMGEPVLERRMHSVLTASRETGIDQRRLRKLLASAGWVRAAGEDPDDAWELFDAVASTPFLRSLSAGVSALELQKQLGISRSQFELLRSDGYFAPSVEGPDHKPLWDIQIGREFIAALLTGATPIYHPIHDWSDIATVAQRLKIRPGEIVKMIESRRLQRIGKHLGRDGYSAILVDRAEIDRLLDRPVSKELSIELFAKTVGLRPKAAMQLIRSGHISTTTAVNPKTQAQQRFLSSGDVAAFYQRFVTLRRLAGLMCLSWQTLRVNLLEADVIAFTLDGEDVGALFEWSGIEAHFFCRWPHPKHSDASPIAVESAL